MCYGEIDEEIIVGQDLIEKKIREILASGEKEVESIIWRKVIPVELSEATYFVVQVIADIKEFKLNKLSLENLEDYQGGNGNEQLDARICKLCKKWSD